MTNITKELPATQKDKPYKFFIADIAHVCTELLKGHLKNISNMWPQIRICRNRLEYETTDGNMWPQIRICGHRFHSVATDSFSFPEIQICGNGLQYVATDSNLWEQI